MVFFAYFVLCFRKDKTNEGSFVIKLFSNWHRQHEKCRDHENLAYHNHAQNMGDEMIYGHKHSEATVPLCWTKRRMKTSNEVDIS